MQTEQIVTLFSLIVIIGGLAYLRRRKTRTYRQTASIPAFTDSMPPGRRVEAARVAQVAADARSILQARYMGSAASRREMTRRGVTQRRWAAAMMLLRDLHIYRRGLDGPQVSERLALRRLRQWEAMQTRRVGHSPAYVANR